MNQGSANLKLEVRKFIYLKLYHQRHYQYQLQFLSFISLKRIQRVCE